MEIHGIDRKVDMQVVRVEMDSVKYLKTSVVENVLRYVCCGDGEH